MRIREHSLSYPPQHFGGQLLLGLAVGLIVDAAGHVAGGSDGVLGSASSPLAVRRARTCVGAASLAVWC